jgi:hypothetical protein
VETREAPGDFSQVDGCRANGFRAEERSDGSPVNFFHLPAGDLSGNVGRDTKDEGEDGDGGEPESVGFKRLQASQIHSEGVQAETGFL